MSRQSGQIEEILKKLPEADAQVIIDVLAERERAEKKLKESEERRRFWLEQSPVCTKIIDLDFNLQYMSHSGIHGLGIDDISEFYGKPYPFYFFPEEAKAKMIANLTQVKQTKQIISKESPVYDVKGNELWFQATIVPLFDDQGEVEHIMVVSVATTERKRAEQQLAEEKERLAVTLQSIGDGVITTDTGGNVLLMNPIAEALTGWELRDASGRPLSEIFQIVNANTSEPVENPVAKVIESGQIVGLGNHALLISKTGDQYHVADSGSPIRDSEGCIIGIVLVFRDVTEEYRIREQLHQSQKMEAIGQLAGGVAHDFNNTLAGISGAAELLGEVLSDRPDDFELVGMIRKSVRKAADLTSKLLAFARRQQSATMVLDLHHVIKESLALLKNSVDRKISFVTELHADRSNVMGDPSHLQNTIMNLAINSSHAMPDGGTITLKSHLVDLNEEYCSDSLFDIEPGTFIELMVTDTGIGIESKDLPRIFEPFFTTKICGKGTGLGLASVFGTIQQHNGSITASSKVGEGSSFHIYLPLTEKETTSPPAEPKVNQGSGTILLVDDEPVLLNTTSAILQSLGYTVQVAENGAVALELFRENPDVFDLVLLDMIMPVMSGKECFMELKKIRPEIKVILLSGFIKEDDLEGMKTKGLKGFVRF